MRWLWVCFATLFVITSGVCAYAQQPGEFVARGEVWDISLEPNGTRVAVLQPFYDSPIAYESRSQSRDKNQIALKSAATGEVLKSYSWSGETIRWIEWADNDKLLICVSQFIEKRTRYVLETRIYTLDVNTGGAGRIFKAKTAKKSAQIPYIDMVQLSEDRQKLAVIYTVKDTRDLRILDLETGKSNVVARGNTKTLSWVVDKNLIPKLRVNKGKLDHIREYYLPSSDGKSWELMASQNQLSEHFSVQSVTEDGDDFLVLTRPDAADTVGLYAFDMRTKTVKDKIFDTLGYDVSSTKFSSESGDLLYTSWWEDNLEHGYMNAQMKTSAQKLAAKLGTDANWTLIQTRDKDQHWLLYVSKDSQPGAYYVWDSLEATLARIAQELPRLDTSKFKNTQRVNYVASDGLPLRGYFTPAASDTKLNRLIVMPHGGPVARDSLDWDSWTQYFSVKGYDVFRPQFRGSGGFGIDFTRKGYGQWAALMQTDIEDGVKALRTQGKIVSSTRKAIIGGSYGGYAALVAATRPDDNYECIVSINGVSDLPKMLESYDLSDPVAANAYEIWSLRMGDPKTQMDILKAASPARNTNKIKAKIRLLHGDADEIVDIEQSLIMFENAKAAGVDISMKTLQGVRHNDWRTYTAIGVLDSTDWFLFTCFGRD